ncbi:MAG: protein kinase domain-containing protein [Gaiellaceae bacterium]
MAPQRTTRARALVRTRSLIPGDVVSERYELEELVGTGGMSCVYRAHDRLLDRHVALKVLHPHYGEDEEYVQRFRHEARAVAQLSHPNIVTVIDRGEADGNQFIVFEYVEGENLKQLIERTGPLPARRAVELAATIADALGFAHENGLVHRDVKPQNVLIGDDGETKVTDFGIARSLDVEHGVTQTGTVLGTSNYLSPEQAGGKQVTAATDVYSLGVVLYELLTGEVPFPGENFVAVAMKHINDPPPDLTEKRPDLPLRLVAAAERALAKDPARRFPSMDAFAHELRASFGERSAFDAERTFVEPSSVVRESAHQRVRAGHDRRSLLLGLLGVLAIVAIVAGVLALGGSKGKHETAGSSAGRVVALRGVGNYDPQGHDAHANTASLATDGRQATYWKTQIYATPAFGGLKRGLGLVLEAPPRAAPKHLTVTTDTPGFTALVESGNSPVGPFAADSSAQQVGVRTTFTLAGHTGRYLVVWITNLGPNGSVHVNEVSASQ